MVEIIKTLTIEERKQKRLKRRGHLQQQIDLVRDYLANEAERGILTQARIDLYQLHHAGRKNWSRPGLQYSKRGPHPHGANPFCNVCNEKFSAGEEVFCFRVGSIIFYHIDCFENTTDSKRLRVIYRDRAYRNKYLPFKELESVIKERTWIDDVEDVHKALRKSGYRGKIG